MLYQIFEVITIYLDFEIVTRFEMQEITFLPKIQIFKQPMLTNVNELMKIYSEMNQKIINISNNNNLDISEKQIIFENYLKKLILDNRLNDFHRIAETEKIFKSCHHVIHNKLLNCSKVDIGIAELLNSVDSVPNFYFYSHSRSVPNIFFTSISIPIPFLNCFYFYSRSRSVPKSILISIPVPRIGTEIAILTFIPILGTN
jgi:hypothetical protein